MDTFSLIMFTKSKINSRLLYFLIVFITEKLTSVECCGRCCDLPQDCQAIRDMGHLTNGVYHIYPDGVYSGIEVYCDMETDDGGWLVFQRRMDGKVDFDRGWEKYMKGFGNVAKEHWLGTQNLHLITSQGAYELRIELTDWDGESRYAKYQTFKVGSSLENYVLTADGYEGDVGENSLFRHHGKQFSTRNRDNDLWADSCANNSSGGWWYSGGFSNCLTANLNGKYYEDGDTGGTETGIMWTKWKGGEYSLKYSEMKIRRLQD